MSTPLRSRALQIVFGGGVAGTAAQALVEWLYKETNDALGRTPEVLDVSKLQPGETYQVTVRPPMTKAERVARARRDKLTAKLDASTAPSRSTIRTARRLAKTQRKLNRSRLSTNREHKLTARADKLGTKFDRATALTPKQQRQRDEIAQLEAQINAERASTLAGVRRVPRRRRATKVLP